MTIETPVPQPRKTYSVVWSRPCGRFGWTDVSDCIDAEEAAVHWFEHVRGKDAPADAQLESVRLVRST